MMPTDVGVVDLMIGFPSTPAPDKDVSLRRLAKDADSQEMNFPAASMFKEVPDHLDGGEDPVPSFLRDDAVRVFNLNVAQ